MRYTTLVNKEKRVNEKVIEKFNLIETKLVDNTPSLIEQKTYHAYLELKEFLKEKDIEISLSSGYRTIENQSELYKMIEQTHGKEYANKYVAKPGYSEHHTGLAIDVTLVRNNKYTLDANELKKDKDLLNIEHYLHKFGFILRYPKDKEEITQQNYEPWHFRYVGKVVSKIMYENNYCLEEYLNEFSGIIPINKPQGVTSFDVVNDIRHIFGIKRVGHTGTLDPLATGVLIVAIGKATKLVELLTSTEKEYIAGVTLGIETDTLDITGNILTEKEIIEIPNIKKTISSFKKEYLQEVPKYAAVKVNGKKLYEYARENKEVILPKKKVTIKEIELISFTKNQFSFKTLVSKGTYIRSLIRDIALSTNNIAVMNSLIRTKQGKVKLEDCYEIEDIKNNNYQLVNLIEYLDYKIIEVTKDIEKQITNGVKIYNNYNIKDKCIFIKENKLLAIYKKENDYLKSYRGF